MTTAHDKPRKKIYQRIDETKIPSELEDFFLKKGYELRLCRWALMGQEDPRFINRKKREGYEPVTKEDNVPEGLLEMFQHLKASTSKGLYTVGDLCLMKITSEDRQAKRDYLDQVAEREAQAADLLTLGKRNNWTDLGTKSTTTIGRSPNIQN